MVRTKRLLHRRLATTTTSPCVRRAEEEHTERKHGVDQIPLPPFILHPSAFILCSSEASCRFKRQTPFTSAPQMCLCSCVCRRAGTRSASIHSASGFISSSPHTADKRIVQRSSFL